jgi:phenylacetate-CoA ligase
VISLADQRSIRLRPAGCRLLLGASFRRAEAVCSSTQWLPGTAVRDQQWHEVLEMLRAAPPAGASARRRPGGSMDMTPDRFSQIPPLTKEEIRRHLSERNATWSRRGMVRTSGASTGAGLAIPIDRDTYSWYMAGTWRGFSWWGVDLANPVVLLLGRSSRSPLHRLLGSVKDWALRWRRVPIDDEFDERAAEILEDVSTYGPAALYGYPSAVYRLACAHRARQRPSPSWRNLKVIVLTGEPVYAFQRQRIQAAFECPVAEEYGMGELGCVAFECPCGRLHVSAETVFLEVVPASAGASGAGRILATHLRNRLFPLIRYDTGDIGMLPADPCPCGRGLPTLRVVGRDADRLDRAGGSEPARPLLEQFFSMLPGPLQGHVRIVHGTAGVVTLQVERNGASAPTDFARAASTAADVFGPAWTVHVEPGRFHRIPSGKLPYFIRG